MIWNSKPQIRRMFRKITAREVEDRRLKLSTKGRYGLRALIDLAQYSGETPVSITSISDRQNISERYLEQLMSMLKKGGLVKSLRGAGGGLPGMLRIFPWGISCGRWKGAWIRWSAPG